MREVASDARGRDGQRLDHRPFENVKFAMDSSPTNSHRTRNNRALFEFEPKNSCVNLQNVTLQLEDSEAHTAHDATNHDPPWDEWTFM
jgi:hypothetical protein